MRKENVAFGKLKRTKGRSAQRCAVFVKANFTTKEILNKKRFTIFPFKNDVNYDYDFVINAEINQDIA